MKQHHKAIWPIVLLLSWSCGSIAHAQEEEEGEEGIVRAQAALSDELTQLEKLAEKLKEETNEKILREISAVNDELKDLGKDLQNMFHAKGETAGEQEAKDFFQEVSGLGRWIDAARKEESKLAEFHKAVAGVLRKGQDLAVFEPND